MFSARKQAQCVSEEASLGKPDKTLEGRREAWRREGAQGEVRRDWRGEDCEEEEDASGG